MNKPLSDKQWQLLSASLDGELTSDEKAAFDALLQSDPAFQQTYNSLLQTRRLLQNLPQKRIPRSFVLTPEMVQKSSGRGVLFPVFSAVSALATFLFVAVLIFSRPSTLPQVAVLEAPAAKEMLTSPATAADTEAKPTPVIIFWGEPAADGKGGGGGGIEESQSLMAPAPPLPPASQPTPEPEITNLEQYSEEEPLTGAGPILGIQEPEAAPLAVTPLSAAGEAETPQPAFQPALAQNWTAIKIGLAGLAVLSALAAYYFWRKSRP